MNHKTALSILFLLTTITTAVATGAGRVSWEPRLLSKGSTYFFFNDNDFYSDTATIDAVGLDIEGDTARRIYEAIPQLEEPDGCDVGEPPSSFAKRAGELYCQKDISLTHEGPDKYWCNVGVELKSGQLRGARDC
jgi:hypothetical protein